MLPPLALEWSAGLIRLRALPHDETVASLAVPGAVFASRHDLALFGGPAMGPVLRVPNATRAPFVRLVGDTLEPLPPVPGEGDLATTACRAHGNGLLTAIDRDTVWVLGPAPSTWAARALPDGIIARDVSFALDGSLWVAGSAPRAGAPPQAVLLRLTERGEEIVSLPLSPKDRRRMARRGADEDYWRVDMEGTPRLVTASCAWSHEDLTDFAIVGWDEGWSVIALDDEPIGTWVREGGLSLYVPGARRILLAGHGEPTRVEDLRPAIQAAWPGGIPSGDPTIHAARARGHELLLAVSVDDWKQLPPRQVKASAVLHSADRGRSFQAWAHIAGGDAELLDVIWSTAT